MASVEVTFQHSMMATSADGAAKQSQRLSRVIMVIQCLWEKGMKIEECKVGMRVVVLDGRNTHSNMRWMPNMDCMIGCEFAVEEIRPGGAKIAGWYMAYEWLSPAPDEQEEKIADSSASLDEVMDKLADKAVEESAVNSCLFLMNEAPIVIGVDPAKPGSDTTVVSVKAGSKPWHHYTGKAAELAEEWGRLQDFGQSENPGYHMELGEYVQRGLAQYSMLARDEVPEETKQALTREPKEIPWYSRITPMSERVKV